MAGFGMLLSLGSSVIGALGQAAAANAQAAAMHAEADEKRRKGMRELAIKSVEAEREMDKTKRLESEQTLRFAASGGGIDGTASEVIRDSYRQGRQNSNLQAWMGEEARRGYYNDAAITDFAASQKKKAIPLMMASSILSGVSGVIRTPSTGGGFGGSFHYANPPVG